MNRPEHVEDDQQEEEDKADDEKEDDDDPVTNEDLDQEMKDEMDSIGTEENPESLH